MRCWNSLVSTAQDEDALAKTRLREVEQTPLRVLQRRDER